MAENPLSREVILFLLQEDTGVLSTADRKGNVSGAVVHYVMNDDRKIYILSGSRTRKVTNIMVHPKFSLVVFDRDLQQTVQVWGDARIESDGVLRERIFTDLVKPRLYGKEYSMPPATKLWDKDYILIALTPSGGTYGNYKKYSF